MSKIEREKYILEKRCRHGCSSSQSFSMCWNHSRILLVLLLLVDEVTSGSVGAISCDPVLLTMLCLVLVVPHHILLQEKKDEFIVLHLLYLP